MNTRTWQSFRKCKRPWGLGKDRKTLLLLIRNVRNCMVKICCSFLESTSGLLFCLLHRHSIQMRLWPGTIVTVLLQVLWVSQDTAEQPCTRETLCIHLLTQTVELAHWVVFLRRQPVILLTILGELSYSYFTCFFFLPCGSIMTILKQKYFSISWRVIKYDTWHKEEWNNVM